MNFVDLVILVLCVLSAVRGWRLGFFGQIFELGGGFLGLIAGVLLAPRVASIFTEEKGLEGALISLAVLLIALSIGQALGYVAGHKFATLAIRARLGPLNNGLGVALGIGLTLVSAWLIASMLVDGPSQQIARAVQRSKVITNVAKLLPRPPNVFAYLRHYLDTSGFPQVFADFPRPVGPPVRLPEDAVARRAVAKAERSTVQIVVPACGGTQLGSGWVAAESTVVTNAHVVAGGESITVIDQTGEHTGRVVVYDPRTDLAVVHVEGTEGPPLPLETKILPRGTPGATLGYPGGRGTLVPHRAAVQDSYEAVGRDIYGRSTVTREIYELRSPVRQGDSGGPFVLPSGEVAGVVFAASTTDTDTGYALTGDEVADEIEQGSGRSDPVSTGLCTR